MSENIMRKHSLLAAVFDSAAPVHQASREHPLPRLAWRVYRFGLIITGLWWVFVTSSLCGCSAVNGWVMNESGLAYYNRGDYESARYEFERALMDSPFRADYAYNVAKVMEKQGDPAGAEQMYQYALTLDPGHELAYRGLSDMLIAQGREGDSQLLLQAWSQTQPFVPGSNIEMARFHQRMGNLPAAEQNLARALRLNPNDPRALNQMGMIYEQTGQPSMAAAYYQQSLMLQPMQPDVESRLSGIGGGVGASPALAMARKVPLTDPTMNGGVSFAGGPVTSPAQIVTTSGTMTGPQWPYASPAMAAPIPTAGPRTMMIPGYNGAQYYSGPSVPMMNAPLAPSSITAPAMSAPTYSRPGPASGAWMPTPSVGNTTEPTTGYVMPRSMQPSPMALPAADATMPLSPRQVQAPAGTSWSSQPTVIGTGVPAVQAF